MLLVELAGHIQQTGSALEDCLGRAVVANVYDGRGFSIWVYGPIPFRLKLALDHVQGYVVEGDTDGRLDHQRLENQTPEAHTRALRLRLSACMDLQLQFRKC